MAEEVRRCLSLPEDKYLNSFMGKCVKNLKPKLVAVIYYGILKGALRPPTNVTDGKDI
jgi:hypothetical protein